MSEVKDLENWKKVHQGFKYADPAPILFPASPTFHPLPFEVSANRQQHLPQSVAV